jgi:UDP-2-acetamido-3-amino-2,3-dideoxy-glucuronate N-acetyltransferase
MIEPTSQIHPSAIIDEGASIGANVKVWHWVHVCTGAVIGKGSSLGQGVYVGRGVQIGANVRIQNHVSIYEGVTLEDDVFCGPSTVFTNVVNPRAAVPRKDEFRPTLVERGATLGANCTIVCGHRIGRHAFIAAGAVVTRDVKSFALMMGVPARQVGWWSAWGERIPLPLKGAGRWICPRTGAMYVLSEDQLTCVNPSDSPPEQPSAPEGSAAQASG